MTMHRGMRKQTATITLVVAVKRTIDPLPKPWQALHPWIVL